MQDNGNVGGHTACRLLALGLCALVALSVGGELALGQPADDEMEYYVAVAASPHGGSRDGRDLHWAYGWDAESGNAATQSAIDACRKAGGDSCYGVGISSMRGGCAVLVVGTWMDKGEEAESDFYSDTTTLGRELAERQALDSCEGGIHAGKSDRTVQEWACAIEISVCSSDVGTPSVARPVGAERTGASSSQSSAPAPSTHAQESVAGTDATKPERGAGEAREATAFCECGLDLYEGETPLGEIRFVGRLGLFTRPFAPPPDTPLGESAHYEPGERSSIVKRFASYVRGEERRLAEKYGMESTSLEIAVCKVFTSADEASRELASRVESFQSWYSEWHSCVRPDASSLCGDTDWIEGFPR